MQKDFKAALSEIGLSEPEAAIYAELIKSPKLTISQIARATNIKRPTCYQHIETLLAKDLILRTPVGKRTFYNAVSPRKLLSSMRERYVALESSIEDMMLQYDESTHKPRVMFYEGKREIKNIYEDIFKTIGDTYSIFPPAAFFKNFTEHEYDEYDAMIGSHAFKSKDLIIKDAHFKPVMRIRNKNLNENKITKALPDSFKSNVDVLIYHDKVALISLRDLSALVIESKDIAELFKSMHQTIWKEL
jgi:sugar-specific transcriptional regulator TrmB